MSTVRSLSTKCSRMHTCATLLQTFYGADGYSIHVSGSWFYMHFLRFMSARIHIADISAISQYRPGPSITDGQGSFEIVRTLC